MSIEIMTFLVVHSLCNSIALQGPLPIDQATKCSENFERLKIALDPDVSWEEFSSFSPEKRNAYSVAAYAHYVRWQTENAERYRRLTKGADLMVRAGI